jgi:hypothetical protein
MRHFSDIFTEPAQKRTHPRWARQLNDHASGIKLLLDSQNSCSAAIAKNDKMIDSITKPVTGRQSIQPDRWFYGRST